MIVRGRFAPSPTGVMHLGNVWTALLAWLSVRSQGGTMILRLEDLDPDRSRPEHAARLLRDLAWLGLDWDEGPDVGGPVGPYVQDERRDRYEAALRRLEALGLTYPCFCARAQLRQAASAPHLGEGEPVYPGLCRRLTAAERDQRARSRRPAVRLRTPAGEISFEDLLAGPVAQDVSRFCGDFVIRRSDGVHAYQLAVVADDAAQGVTEVVRGFDLLDSTPRQLLLYGLLGLTPPRFAHAPLLLDPAGVRLSKRQAGVDLASLQAAGVAPEAIIGFLAWKAGLQDFPRPVRPGELIPRFSFARLPPGPVIVGDELAGTLSA